MQGTKPPKLRAREFISQDRFALAPAAVRQSVAGSQIRIFYELSHLAILATVLVVALAGVALYGRVSTLELSAWAALLLVVAAGRHVVSRRFLSLEVDDAELPAWGRRAWIGSLLQSVAWSIMILLVARGEHAADLYITIFLLTGLAVGSFATLGFFLPAYVAFCVPLLLALSAWILLAAPEMTFWLAGLLVVAGTFLGQGGARASRMLRSALLLNHEREQWLEAVTDEKDRMGTTLQSIGDGVISADTDGKVVYLNGAAENLTGWSAADAAGQSLARLLHPKDDPELPRLPDLLGPCVGEGKSVEWEGRLLDRHGQRESAVRIKATPIVDGRQRVTGAVVVIHDVTELAGLAETVYYQSRHDGLTGLPNLKTFERRIAEAMEHSRHSRAVHAVCYLDLDQFKIVNDTCGHSAGDELLKQLSELLRRRIRDSDVLARLGGDEFGVLLYRCPPAKAEQIAEDFNAIVRDFRFSWEDHVFNVGVSIGLVPFDAEGTAAQVLAAADAACYVAKDQGRNRIHIAYPGDAEVESRHGEMRQTSLIQRALDDGLFRLRFQRIVALGREAPVKAEFLVSMLGAKGELLAPGQFLPAAERFNMMPRLDRHIVRMVFQYAASGRPELADIDAFAVNLSGQSLADRDFLEFVVEALAQSRVDPARICFEITETSVITNMERALAFIERLRGQGCRFALDDFGSGLSSFGYLKNLAVDYLKIDGQFVKNMCDDPVNRSIVEAIHQVGHIMGLKTIAEFVEDERIIEALREVGVDYGQGWGIHKPTLLEPLAAETTASS